MISKESLKKVWFPTTEEWGKYLERFSKPLNLSQEVKNIIEGHYYKALDKYEIVRLSTTCPNCHTELKKKVSNMPWGEVTNYVCPNWKPNNLGCIGYRMNHWDYERRKKTPNIVKGRASLWIQRLDNELKEKKYNISRSMIYRYLKEKGLPSPIQVERELIESTENRTYNMGRGYNKAKKNSILQESQALNMLQTLYGKENVQYQQKIFYQLKNESNKINHKKIDFLIYNNDEIIIKETKLEEYYQDEEQKADYLTLISFMFPDKKVRFEYIFDKGEAGDDVNGV